MTEENIFRIVCGAAVLIMLIYYLKREKKLISFLFGAISGAAALIILNKYGGIIGVNVPMNIFNFSGGVVLGVPFVVCLALIKRLI